jgi:hypothetical protein
MQPYLNKLPVALIEVVPELHASLQVPSEGGRAEPTAQGSAVGMGYRPADFADRLDAREPFSVDPALVERGLRGHASTQNQLAEVIEAAGQAPRSCRPDEPNFDLAWDSGGVVYVAEVKSITASNEDKQLRLGLGQVLYYRHELRRRGHDSVVAVLAVERAPRDTGWIDLCAELGVRMVWPETMADAALW